MVVSVSDHCQAWICLASFHQKLDHFLNCRFCMSSTFLVYDLSIGNNFSWYFLCRVLSYNKDLTGPLPAEIGKLKKLKNL